MTAMDLLPFIRASGLVDGWSDKSVLDFIVWRASYNNVLVSTAEDGSPTGVVIWHTAEHAEDLPDPWQPPARHPRACYFDFMINLPGRGLGAVWNRFKAMQPDWQSLEYYAHRAGRMVKYPARFVEHLERTAQNV